MENSILRTTSTAAVTDPVTKRHVQKMADATALALATSSGKHSSAFRTQLQSLEKQDRTFGFKRQQEQLHHGSHRGKNTEVEDQSLQQQQNQQSHKFNFQTKASKNILDETSLILNPQFLGNVAAQYQPQPPPPFIPVSTISSGGPSLSTSSTNKNNKNQKSSSKKKKRNSSPTNATTSGSDLESNNNKQQMMISSSTIPTAPDTLPAAIETSIPPLDTAAPARNLCIELLSTRVVSCVKAVSLLLQEHSSSPGQSLPHVAVLGAGNVGKTVLNHLVKLLPADRIAILARDAKSEVCNHFSTKYGVRALSTNILKDERLVDVIKSHRNKLIEQSLKKQQEAGLISSSSSTSQQQQKKQPFFGSSSSSTNNTTAHQMIGGGGANDDDEGHTGNSHVAPEVAAAQNISVALQQVHVLIICCRPAQLSEVASSLQPWLRSSSVVVVSTLVGVTADRVASLFRVPSSLSVTVDTNEMIFDFETRSRLHAKAQENAAAAATLIGNLQNHSNQNNNNEEGDSMSASSRQLSNFESSLRGNSTSVVGALMNMNRAEEALASPSSAMRSKNNNKNENNNQNEEEASLLDHYRSLSLLETQKQIAEQQNHQFRFFTREPLDFLHRLFFALVSTLLERCGVGPADAWMAVAKLFLGNTSVKSANILKKREGFSIVQGSFIQLPKGVGAQGPTLVAKCSVQVLAQAAGMSVGEAVRIIDERMVAFAGF